MQRCRAGEVFERDKMAAESIANQLSKITVRANAKIEDLAGRATRSGSPTFVNEIRRHYTGADDVWRKFMGYYQYLSTGDRYHLYNIPPDKKAPPPLPVKAAKAVAVKPVKSIKPIKALSPAAKKASRRISKQPGAYWNSLCANEEDPITLNAWGDYKSASEIVSIALPDQPDTRFCYDRANLIQSLQHPASSSSAWDAKRANPNLPIGTVYRNPRGQYMSDAARQLIVQQPRQYMFQLVQPHNQSIVGSTRDNTSLETVYGLKSVY